MDAFILIRLRGNLFEMSPDRGEQSFSEWPRELLCEGSQRLAEAEARLNIAGAEARETEA